MQLKSYQNEILRDLGEFLDLVGKNQNLNLAWQEFFRNKPQIEKIDYKENIKGVVEICFKVPTGGGKTIIGASSLKVIFDKFPKEKPKFVVWLVPSDTILTQTFENFTNLNHPYAKRLKADFGEVAIYDKEMLLGGENFSEVAVQNQLSIAILSMQSIRSKNKDSRKIYEENGALAKFNTIDDRFEDNSLISILRKYNPVVVIDESHNAKSDLSTEMKENLNPSFILELTATPVNSNVLSRVEAWTLKQANMVKLPVVVYKIKEKDMAIRKSIEHRVRLENEAIKCGENIRPIVLFQAESKNTKSNPTNAEKEEERKTFEKIKENLIKDYGIKESEIAIKTANINELKGVNLMSNECKIRYIITINALKEGWDCPFAYILTSLANRSSAVEIEQIVGRILRQPYTKKSTNQLLNASYVFFSSDDFGAMLENVEKGLLVSGFGKGDYCAIDESKNASVMQGEIVAKNEPNLFTQNRQSSTNTSPKNQDYTTSTSVFDENFAHSNTQEIDEIYESTFNDEEVKELTIEKIENYEKKEGEEMAKKNSVLDEFKDEILELKIPQFLIKIQTLDFGDDSYELLEKENLMQGFDLDKCDTNINFEKTSDDVRMLDIDEKSDIKYLVVKQEQKEKYFKEYFDTLSDESKIKTCIAKITDKINDNDSLKREKIEKYVTKVVEIYKFDDFFENYEFYGNKIKEHINKLLDEYCENKFYDMLMLGEIVCRENYQFPKSFPLESLENSKYPKNLYEYESIGDNNLEKEIIFYISNLDNIKWWHRIKQRRKDEFFINGPFENGFRHYPDFIVMTKKGKILLVETKGGDRNNSDSVKKLKLGLKWSDKSGDNFKYCMVFSENKLEGSFTVNEFFEIVKKL